MNRDTRLSDEAQEALDLEAARRVLVLVLRLVDERRMRLAGYIDQAA